jgi:hypothetical protein
MKKRDRNTVNFWLDELEAALDYREAYAYEKHWADLENCFYNDPSSNTSVGPNLIYSEGDTLLAGTWVSRAEILLDPDDYMSVPSAPVAERVINRLIKPGRMGLNDVVFHSQINNYLNGKAIIKLGYDSEFGWSPSWDMGSLQYPSGISQTQFDKKGNRIEFLNTVPGMPWCTAVSPHDFLVPWGTGPNIDNAEWVAHRVIRETGHILADPKYKNTSRLEPQMSMRDYVSSYLTMGSRSYRTRPSISTRSRFNSTGDLLYNELWEIYDRRDNTIKVVCFTHDKFLRNDPNVLMQCIGGFPFIAASFVYSARHFWTPPLAFYLYGHQQDSYDTFVQIGKQRRLNVLKFIMQDGMMTDDELSKIFSGDVGAVAKSKKMNKSLRDAFVPIPTGQNYDLINEVEVIRRNTRDIMGFSRNQMGEYDTSSRRTAYEAHRVFEGTETRAVAKDKCTLHLYTESSRKTLSIVGRLWTTPRPVCMGNEWKMFTGSDIIGKYLYSACLTQKPLLTRMDRKKLAMQDIAFLAQFPGANMQRMEEHILIAANDPSYSGFFTGVNDPNILSSLQPAGGGAGSTPPQPGLGGGGGREQGDRYLAGV